MKAMILAAGRGQRMAPLTDHCPKPLLALAGKPLIEHHIDKLVAAGMTDLVINHAWLGEMIEARLQDGHQFGANIRYSAETDALETAGGIRKALPLLGDQPFLVINGDVWTDWDYREAVQVASSEMVTGNTLAWLWLTDNPDHNPTGDFFLDGTDVAAEADGPGFTFTGISLIHPDLLAALPVAKLPLAPILRQAMDSGRVKGCLLDGRWTDVGTPQRLAELEQQLTRETF
ncbi:MULTISPECIES: N-acetylmuramate alpha-1-phosphate uridylyltransferase MurU [unclassified Oceanobacter]|uniref:N-acetylmuramate alpha-1-phosphate uridylyltransferase MurU n=1 Tax=unclassified Oceanobacter TaxID=2620260 RepID=UPI0027357AB9|nr:MULTISPECIES: nucleotidyltransferase family protein [unclassified Oceanobacter]MDP2609877.1 nucleotidyltransferase family protein [Oceanobacter sp. 1_MG-2023]MDP2612245.1 nucleotidyltransferase family protein [Oceanobacter sp. 2_MG-2023]